jgi:hypothetical protein
MANKKNVHVTYNDKSKDWGVKTEGASRAVGRYDRKTEATQSGRNMAIKRKGELFIHNMDGKISDRDSYGRDPNPPKDKVH